MDRGYDTRSPIQKTSSLPKTFALFRVYIISVLLVMFVAVFFVCAYAPVFNIRSVHASGSSITPDETIEVYAAKVLEGNWRAIIPFNTSVGVPVKTLEESILKTFPSIEKVFVDRAGVSGLHISLTERTPQLVYCRGNDCAMVDGKGTVFALSERVGYEIIEGSPAQFMRRSATTTEDAIVLGEILLSQFYKTSLDKTRDFLISNNFAVRKISLAPLGFFDVAAVSSDASMEVQFRFRANEKLDQQLYELQLAFDKGLLQKINNQEVEYVISYIPQKVIYKNN